MLKRIFFLFIIIILMISCRRAVTRPNISDLGTPPSEGGIPDIPDITPPDNEEDYYIKANDTEETIKSKIQKYYEKHGMYIALVDDTEDNIEKNGTIEKINNIINNDIYSEGVFLDLSKTDMTKIADNSFMDNKHLSSVKLPDTMKSIGNSAFANAEKLSAINFPASLESIGTSAFSLCVSLVEIDLKYTKIKTISENSFDGCSKLEKAVLPDGILVIGNAAFNNCLLLKTINFPDTLTEINVDAFKKCENLVEVNLQSTKITIIYEHTFNSCSKLESVYLPNNLSEIKNSAFAYCYSLKEIDFPESLTIIGPFSFTECGFERLILKEGLVTIDNLVFYKCSYLKQISLPSTLTKIGTFTFTGCTSLIDIEYNGDNPATVQATDIFKSYAGAEGSTPNALYLPNVDDPASIQPPSQDPNPWINFLGYDWTDKINYKQSMPNE